MCLVYVMIFSACIVLLLLHQFDKLGVIVDFLCASDIDAKPLKQLSSIFTEFFGQDFQNSICVILVIFVCCVCISTLLAINIENDERRQKTDNSENKPFNIGMWDPEQNKTPIKGKL